MWDRYSNGSYSSKVPDLKTIYTPYIACCFVWLWNLVADIAGGNEAEGV